jgi:hypothetical protein
MVVEASDENTALALAASSRRKREHVGGSLFGHGRVAIVLFHVLLLLASTRPGPNPTLSVDVASRFINVRMFFTIDDTRIGILSAFSIGGIQESG